MEHSPHPKRVPYRIKSIVNFLNELNHIFFKKDSFLLNQFECFNFMCRSEKPIFALETLLAFRSILVYSYSYVLFHYNTFRLKQLIQNILEKTNHVVYQPFKMSVAWISCEHCEKLFFIYLCKSEIMWFGVKE